MRRRRRDGGENAAAGIARWLESGVVGRGPHLLVDREADLATHVLLLRGLVV